MSTLTKYMSALTISQGLYRRNLECAPAERSGDGPLSAARRECYTPAAITSVKISSHF
jgi:hypothetical protein